MGRRWRWRRTRGRGDGNVECLMLNVECGFATASSIHHSTFLFVWAMFYELSEAFRIAFSIIRAHKMRSVLTALGVIIGIIAVTLMGSAISGIEIGFERSLSVIGDDILYVEKWPWHHVDDWWNYRNRRRMEVHYADDLKRIIRDTPNSQLITAVPTLNTVRTIKYGDNQANGVFTQGTTDEFVVTSTSPIKEGRFFTETESRGARNVCL